MLESENGCAKVEVSIQTEGKILGVGQTCLWSYWSETRADGSIHGQGKGFMKTNTIAGAMEYGVDGVGNTVTKVWEGK